MKSIPYFVVVCALSTFSLGTLAEEQTKPPRHPECDRKEAIASAFFPDLAIKSQAVKAAACGAEDPDRLRTAFDKYLEEARRSFDYYGGFIDGNSPVVFVQRDLASGHEPPQIVFRLPDQQAPELELSMSDAQGTDRYFEVADVGKCDHMANSLQPNKNADCIDVLSDFEKNYNLTQALNENERRRKVLGNIRVKRTDWEPFLEYMKGQTPLELWVNGGLFYEEHKDSADFVSPPSTQLVILSPTILIENVSDAVDGEQTQEALAIEAIGMNWWQNKKWYQPSGASLIALYSDRESVEDWGYGISIRFGGKYSIAVSDHDGNAGVSVSLDLVKLFQSNENIKKAYKVVFD